MKEISFWIEKSQTPTYNKPCFANLNCIFLFSQSENQGNIWAPLKGDRMIWVSGLILVMALLGAPLFSIIGASSYISYASVPQDALGGGLSFNTFFSEIMDKLAASSLFITIPFFAFAGFLLAESGAPKRLVNLCRSLLWWAPGGLGIVAIITCAVFTAFTGASGVTIIALGGLLYPALARDHYPERFRLGLLTTCGSLGLLFPPSLPLILYALVASNSVDPNFFPGQDISALTCDVNKLFQAGIIPGIILVLILAAYTAFVHKRIPLEKKEETRDDTLSIFQSFKDAIFELPLPFVVVGGIYGGFLTVDHAASILVAYVLLVEVLIYRDIPLRKIPKIVQRTAALVGAILIILCMAIGFSNYLVHQHIPDHILDFMKNHLYEITLGVLFNICLLILFGIAGLFTSFNRKVTAVFAAVFLVVNLLFSQGIIPMGVVESLKGSITPALAFLIVLNVFLLIVGCLMDIFSAILVVVPIIVPLALQFGINPYHLGIIFLTNLEIGYSTPPVGINLFISSLRFQKPILTLYLASIPFLILLLIALALITYVPGLSLFLL